LSKPKISCLCVTRNRVDLLRRAVNCFLHQTYPARELLVVWESDDVATKSYVGTLSSPDIRGLEIPAEPKQTLGALRNLAVSACHGHYFAQWDDDDWHAPTRLADQLAALQKGGKPACVLARWLMYDEVTGQAYVSRGRRWEGSLVCDRAFAPLYVELPKGEDLPVVEALWQANHLALLDRPDLYIYVYHAGNTWDRSHWLGNILPLAKELAPDVSLKIADILAGRSQLIAAH
jgi:glycosyltransferase involved in cell wall biosynthesis